MIKLKNIIKINEQGVVPPVQPPQTDVPVAPAPTAPATEPGSPEQASSPTAQTGEYDFTKDFKEFEDAVNKAKSESKKKFLDKLNSQVVGKKNTVNASRGYGQPQKDYTINKVAKASVDWYYNKNVVVLTDENGKEYFLTPGVNIKIEGGNVESPEGPPTDQVPSEPPSPTSPAPESPTKEPVPDTGTGENPTETPPAATPTPQSAPVPAVPEPEENPEEPEQKIPIKEKVSSNTKISKDIKNSLSEFLVNENILLYRFITHQKTTLNGARNVVHTYIVEIPKKEFNSNAELKEMKLNLINGLRNRFQPSDNIVEVESVGKNYIFTIIKEMI